MSTTKATTSKRAITPDDLRRMAGERRLERGLQHSGPATLPGGADGSMSDDRTVVEVRRCGRCGAEFEAVGYRIFRSVVGMATTCAACQAAEEQEREEAAEREEWGREHGSPRLRRLLEEEIEHGAVYFDERFAAERPGWSENAAIPTREPRNAPEEALGLLDEARKTAPDAKLVYWVAYLPCEYCDEDEDDCRCEIDEVRGYTAEATFLGRKIVYQVDEDGVPPVVVD